MIMVLIFGGAYQGKLEYAIENYKIREDEIFYCGNNKEIDFSKKVIYGIEKLTLNLLKDESDPLEYINKNIDKIKDKIIICTDISCGVVPTDPLLRQWREAVGRCMALLSHKAERVIRVFCGIGTILK